LPIRIGVILEKLKQGYDFFCFELLSARTLVLRNGLGRYMRRLVALAKRDKEAIREPCFLIQMNLISGCFIISHLSCDNVKVDIDQVWIAHILSTLW
jgi:hypothetical protein